uniref:Uncharacterized protein n=1 Tax=Vespula pensylvanica TaxID=30213 RepID=A0A834NQL5_VESPE|nr:hypothetical protein H0235_012265 [Vespula pensylvanica]
MNNAFRADFDLELYQEATRATDYSGISARAICDIANEEHHKSAYFGIAEAKPLMVEHDNCGQELERFVSSRVKAKEQDQFVCFLKDRTDLDDVSDIRFSFRSLVTKISICTLQQDKDRSEIYGDHVLTPVTPSDPVSVHLSQSVLLIGRPFARGRIEEKRGYRAIFVEIKKSHGNTCLNRDEKFKHFYPKTFMISFEHSEISVDSTTYL